VIRGGGFLVLAISPSTLMAATGLTNVYGPFVGRLSNNGAKLELRNNSGWLEDSVSYGVDGDWPVAPDGSGVSLAKLDRDSASDAAANWVASEQIGGTPGTDNFPLLGVILSDTRVLSSEQVWKYDASGTDLGVVWRTPGYNDSAWASGPGLFYNGAVAAGDFRAIPTLFNTGLGANGTVLSSGRDPHYLVTLSAQTMNPPPPTPAICSATHVCVWVGA
jgi:hypothetical protein